MQISELLCRAEYIMRATARPPSRRLFPTLPLPTPSFQTVSRRLTTRRCCSYLPPPAYPRQLHFAINLRYRTCDRIRRRSWGPANFESEVGKRGLRRYPAMPAKSISKENIISRGKRPLNSIVNKLFNL